MTIRLSRLRSLMKHGTAGGALIAQSLLIAACLSGCKEGPGVSVDPSGKEFPVYQYCITGRVRLRSEPSLAGRVTGLIEEGEKTAVLGESREKTAFTFHDRRYTSRWLKLRRGNGDEGWAQGIFFHENRFPHREEIGKTGIYPLGWGPSGTFAFFEFMGDSCARDCGDVSLVLFNGKTGKRSSYLTHSCVRDVQNHREQHIVPLYEILGREGITHAGTVFHPLHRLSSAAGITIDLKKMAVEGSCFFRGYRLTIKGPGDSVRAITRRNDPNVLEEVKIEGILRNPFDDRMFLFLITESYPCTDKPVLYVHQIP